MDDNHNNWLVEDTGPFVQDPGAKCKQVPLGTFRNLFLDEAMPLISMALVSRAANGGSLPLTKKQRDGSYQPGSAVHYSQRKKEFFLTRVGCPEAWRLKDWLIGKKAASHPFGIYKKAADGGGKAKPVLTIERAIALSTSDPRYTPYVWDTRQLAERMSEDYVCPSAACFSFVFSGARHAKEDIDGGAEPIQARDNLEDPEPVATPPGMDHGPRAGLALDPEAATRAGRDYLALALPMIERSSGLIERFLQSNTCVQEQNDRMLGQNDGILAQNNESLAALRNLQQNIMAGAPPAPPSPAGPPPVGHPALLAEFDKAIEELDEPEPLPKKELRKAAKAAIRAKLAAESEALLAKKKANGKPPKTPGKGATKSAALRKRDTTEKNAAIRAKLSAASEALQAKKKANGKPPKTPGKGATKSSATAKKSTPASLKKAPASAKEPAGTPRSSKRKEPVGAPRSSKRIRNGKV